MCISILRLYLDLELKCNIVQVLSSTFLSLSLAQGQPISYLQLRGQKKKLPEEMEGFYGKQTYS